MTIKISDIANLVKDFCRNQSFETDRIIRVINSACDFIFSWLGLPCQEREYRFDFYETQTQYPLPVDFSEFISLRFENDELNRRGTFSYRPVEYLYESVDNLGKNSRLVGIDSATGNWRLWVLAHNSKATLTLDTFDTNTKWTALHDASDIRDDRITYKEGIGSLAFDITPTSFCRATIKKVGEVYNLKEYQDIADFKMYVYLPEVVDLTSISFNWGSSDTDYFKQTVTTQEDGTAFQVGWNDISFPWNGAIQVGSPDLENINKLWIDFDYENTYNGGVNYRLDFLRVNQPDKMILTYYTKYKGQTSTGTDVEMFTSLDDNLFIGDFDVGLMNLIAIYASLLLAPQLLQDNKWLGEQYQMYLTSYSRKYPRKRANNLLTIPSLPRTD